MNARITFEIGPELLAVNGTHPFVGGNKAENPATVQELDATLIKVDIEIRCSGEALVYLFEYGFLVLYLFLSHIGRIADYDIESCKFLGRQREHPLRIEEVSVAVLVVRIPPRE